MPPRTRGRKGVDMMKVGEMSELSAEKPLRVSLGSEKILIFLVNGAPVATASWPGQASSRSRIISR